MDQAIKSALDKYHGKNTSNNGQSSHKPMGVTSVFLICIAIIIILSLCIKYDFLGAGKAWNKVENINLGKTTVSQMIDTFKERFKSVFEANSTSKSTDPVNSSGESGNITTSAVDSTGITADYINNHDGGSIHYEMIVRDE